MNQFFSRFKRSFGDFVSKLLASVRKLDLWPVNIETKKYQMFRVDTSLLVAKTIQEKLLQEIGCHLKLKTLLMHYFPSIVSCPYIFNLFFVYSFDHMPNSMKKQSLIFNVMRQLKLSIKNACQSISG